MTMRTGWPSSHHHSLDIEHEHRLTKAEMNIDRHRERLDMQDTWNKGFALSLIGLASVVANAKMATFVELLRGLLKSSL